MGDKTNALLHPLRFLKCWFILASGATIELPGGVGIESPVGAGSGGDEGWGLEEPDPVWDGDWDEVALTNEMEIG